MKQFVSLVFVFILINNHLVFNQVVVDDFRQEALAEHNAKRQLHCTGPMTLNASLNTVAQNYAEYLATNNLFNHSQTPGLGENLFQMSSSAVITSLQGKTKKTTDESSSCSIDLILFDRFCTNKQLVQ